MRLGLIGTGHWARVVHATSASRLTSIEFVGVWGRNASAAEGIATDFGVTAYADPDSLIADVDALTFAVPPAVQVDIAIRAAQRGRHLLLEKPVALDPAQAHELERALGASHAASIVFFTQRFVETTQDWLEQARATNGWIGARAEFLSNIYQPGGPFAESAWRREHGALWDIGPHALSLLCPVLGPVSAVVAGRGARDHVNLILRHAERVSSSVSLSLTAPPAIAGRTFYFDGESGRLALPSAPQADVVRAHQAALRTLIDLSTQRDPSHPCDIHFGAQVVDVLAAAEQSLASNCWVTVG
jgi:predicted dehydrogenase